jgi:hypothetical protein
VRFNARTRLWNIEVIEFALKPFNIKVSELQIEMN